VSKGGVHTRDRRAAHAAPGPRRGATVLDAFGLGDWWRSKTPVLRFVGVFLLVVGAFFALSEIPIVQQRVYPAYLALSAEVAGWTLGLLGRDVSVEGAVISGGGASVKVKIGCDASEPIVFLLATMLAFPAPRRARLLGILVGVPVLLALNIVRIVTLFETSLRRPEWFHAVHIRVWQPTFILAVLLIWIAWVALLTRAAPSSLDARVDHA